MIQGLSYGSRTGSLAYPLRTKCKEKFNSDMALIILELVHPLNLGELPPKPSKIASLGDMLGIAKYSEFWTTIWY